MMKTGHSDISLNNIHTNKQQSVSSEGMSMGGVVRFAGMSGTMTHWYRDMLVRSPYYTYRVIMECVITAVKNK